MISFAALPSAHIDSFLHYINSLSKDIKLSHETEQNNCILYVYLMIRRQINGQLRFSVYRKDMHTDSTLFHQTESHCSEEFKEAECNTVKQSLTLNGYSNRLINTCR